MDLRRIVFRGKTKDGVGFVYGDLVHKRNGLAAIEDGGGLRADIDETTIGQFTGLKDINEVEIYEGDVVDWTFFRYYGTEEEHRLRGIIEWYQGGFIFRVIENDFENAGFYGISDLNTDTESDCEIIGNIYDNPELINKEK